MRVFFSLIAFLTTHITHAQCDSFEVTLFTASPTCPGYCDGALDGYFSGFTGGVNTIVTNAAGSIVINPWATGTCPNCLCPGWYFLEAIDSAGCTLSDSVYIADIDEMEILLNITLPSDIDSCDGQIEIDTVLNYSGDLSNLSYYWNPGGPDGIGAMSISNVCYGDYMLTVNNELGCGSTLNFSVGNLALEIEEDVFLSVYPVPSKDVVYVTSDRIIEQFAVFNISGELLFSNEVDTAVQPLEIDLSMLEKGVYLLHLKAEQQIIQKQIVKI